MTDRMSKPETTRWPPGVSMKIQMAWQPIETAPKDGTIIALTNGTLFAFGKRDFCIENDWTFLGFDEGERYPDGSQKIGERFTEKVPNPNAGKRHEWWSLFGCTAYDEATETQSGDGCLFFTPTHWMPSLDPPP